MTDDPAALDKPPLHHRWPFDRYRPVEDIPGDTEDQWQARVQGDRVAALREALAGVELGAYDERMVEHFADLDTPELGALVSLLLRVRAAGRAEGN